MSEYRPHQADDQEELAVRVVEFVREFTASHRYPPSIREIQAGCEMNTLSWAYTFVMRLVEEGRLAHTPGIARSIHIPGPGKRKHKSEMGRLRRVAKGVSK